MVVDVHLSKGRLLATLHYGSSILSTISALNVANTCMQAIQGIVTDPTRNVKNIDLFTLRDLDQLNSWNQPSPLQGQRLRAPIGFGAR